MVPYEAFLSEKPVLTTTDAGGPLEVVTDGRTGYVTSPDAGRARPRRADACASTRTRQSAYGRAGKELASRVTWDTCIETLLS